MPDQVRHDGVRLSNCQVNIIENCYGKMSVIFMWYIMGINNDHYASLKRDVLKFTFFSVKLSFFLIFFL